MEGWTEYTRFTVTLLAIVDPFGTIPIFLSTTRDQTREQKARTVRTTALVVFATLAVAAFTGKMVLEFLGTSLDAFRVGGGLVLLLMALSMLSAQIGPVRQTPEEFGEAAAKEAVAVVPLALPLLAGPGAISTTIIEVEQGSGPLHMAVVLACVALVCVAAWLSWRMAVPLGQRMGVTGFNVLNRLLGLLVAAIAIQIMAEGLRGLFPGLT